MRFLCDVASGRTWQVDSDAQAVYVFVISKTHTIREETFRVAYVSRQEKESGECNSNSADSLEIDLLARYFRASARGTYVDDEGPPPTCTPFCAVKCRREGALCSAR